MAQVIDYGSDTYTATCVGMSRVATVPHRADDPMNEAVKQRKPSVRVLFFFPDDTSEGRYMREPPRLGHQVRSPEGAVWTVAEVFHTGLDTYTVMCEAPSLAPDLLQRAKDSISPLAMRRRDGDTATTFRRESFAGANDQAARPAVEGYDARLRQPIGQPMTQAPDLDELPEYRIDDAQAQERSAGIAEGELPDYRPPPDPIVQERPG